MLKLSLVAMFIAVMAMFTVAAAGLPVPDEEPAMVQIAQLR
jgi:hypothetical protein